MKIASILLKRPCKNPISPFLRNLSLTAKFGVICEHRYSGGNFVITREYRRYPRNLALPANIAVTCDDRHSCESRNPVKHTNPQGFSTANAIEQDVLHRLLKDETGRYGDLIND